MFTRKKNAEPHGFDPSLGSMPATAERPDPASAIPPPPKISCAICESGQTRYFQFYSQIGLILASIDRDHVGNFCSDCAKSLGRKAQNVSIALGWLGIFALVTNFGKVIANTKYLVRASGLAPPAPRNEETLDPGRPLLLRVGWLLPFCYALFVIYEIALAVQSG